MTTFRQGARPGVLLAALIFLAMLLVTRYFGVFTEYKFTFSDLDADVAHGSGDFDERSHHLIAGVTVPLPLW